MRPRGGTRDAASCGKLQLLLIRRRKDDRRGLGTGLNRKDAGVMSSAYLTAASWGQLKGR